MSTSSEIKAIVISNAWGYYQSRVHFENFTKNLYDPNRTCWVRISDPDSSRRGSIGRAVPKGYDVNDTSSWQPRPLTNRYGGRMNELDDQIDIYLGENKRLLNYRFKGRGIEWLPDYKGEATWCFNKKEAKPKYQFKDAMGDVIELGDFGVYADSTGTIMFGTVTKISKVGMIYVTNIKTPKISSYEIRLKSGDQFCRMTKDIFQRLMVMKLAG